MFALLGVAFAEVVAILAGFQIWNLSWNSLDTDHVTSIIQVNSFENNVTFI